MKPLGSHFLLSFAEVINISHALWVSIPPEWSNISSFRNKYSKFYSKILQSIVFLQSPTNKEQLALEYDYVNLEDLVKFSIEELSGNHNDSEDWRNDAAFDVILSCIQSQVPFSDPNLIHLAISEIKKHDRYQDQISSLLLAVSTSNSSLNSDQNNESNNATISSQNSESSKSNEDMNEFQKESWNELMEMTINGKNFNIKTMATLLNSGTS